MTKIAAKGQLFLVATPIGNLGDISLRALETLKQVDLIAAEDTRHSQKLLQHYGIQKPLQSLHQHNERQRSQKLLATLEAGQNIALICDAGTPLISDPGYRLIALLHKHAIQLVPIPGACAAISALTVSGLPTDRFVFEGFLPSKGELRRQRIKALVNEPRTIILYEAVHRVLNLVTLLTDEFGPEREACLVRELTKRFETIKLASLANLLNWLNEKPDQLRGEFVLVLRGQGEMPVTAQTDAKTRKTLATLLETLPLKEAVNIASKITEQKRNDLYKLALELKKLKQSTAG